jgi:anaerobic dimethyl sulfoxide reductase subunit A
MHKKKGGMSRRAFVGASAVAALTLASACSPENKLGETEDRKIYRLDTDLDENVEGKWVTAYCADNCGGMCLNKVYVVDGVAVRQKTDDTHEDSVDNPQLRACPRGRARRQDTFGVDRLKYPMKRKNWEPLTGGQKELRGVDEWVRISWDEALDAVSAEIKHVIQEYGNRSILMGGSTVYSDIAKIFNLLGGAVSMSSTFSHGTTCFTATAMGLPYVGLGEENDRFDYVNADTIVFYGCNPAWASGGTYTSYFLPAKEAGVNFVYVGPDYNATASLFDARWITVRPGTDTAFLLAVAYEMFMADEENPGSVIDWDFVHTYSIGVDGESMPADAKLGENFKDYVLGNYDDLPKTPEWATEICGAPAEDIKRYAQLMNRNNAITTLRSYAASRCNDSDNWLQLMMAIGIMGGHIGKPGHCTGAAYHKCVGSGMPYMIQAGSSGLPNIDRVLDDVINDAEQWDAVLNGKFNCAGEILLDDIRPQDIRDIDVHLICFEGTSAVNSNLATFKGIQALRKADFVFSTARSLTSQARYSDIVLPVATQWEEVGGVHGGGSYICNREVYIVHTKVTEPLYEAKTTSDVIASLCEKLGIDSKVIYPIDDKQQFFNILQTTMIRNKDNTDYETFLTITQEDIDEWGVDSAPQEGVINLREFIDQGIYRMNRSPGDVYQYYGFQNFIADPVANPLPSPSGKFEIYCQRKADAINAAGWTKDYVWKPYPTYKRPVNGYEDSFADWETKEKGEFPYQIFNPHYLRRSHTLFDNLPWLREAFAQPFFITVEDAKEKGIADGDTVRIWNNNGQILRKATLTERMMRGCVALPHGAWVEVDPETGMDKAGTDNVLTSPMTSGLGVAGYNTNLVDFEKYDGPALEPDYTWPQRIIEL